MANDAVRVADIFARDISLIDPDPDNCRDIESPQALADIEEIALSIMTRGFDADRAILVRKTSNGRWMVTDGHKRHRATLRAIELGAEIRAIPCRSEEKGTNEQDRAILRLRQPGRELTALEAAIDIKRLMGWGWSDVKIAERLGKKPDWVGRCLELAGAPIEVRQAVRDEQISATEAIKVVRLNGAAAGEVITKAVERAHGEGRTRARPRDIEAVTKSRVEAPSLCGVAVTVVMAWESGSAAELDAALGALAGCIGNATLEAARLKLREWRDAPRSYLSMRKSTRAQAATLLLQGELGSW